MKTVVLCGDSYYDFDDRFPGLHWADKLIDANVYRLARGGASNFSIWHQVQHSIKFSPDLVLITFTSCPRVEFPKSNSHTSLNLTSNDLEDMQWNYRNTIYENIDHALPKHNRDKFLPWMPYYIEEYEFLKNCIFIKSTLDFLIKNNTKFYFTYGEFEDTLRSQPATLVDFTEYEQYNILPNGAHYHTKLLTPYFHIKDDDWHKQHADVVGGLM